MRQKMAPHSSLPWRSEFLFCYPADPDLRFQCLLSPLQSSPTRHPHPADLDPLGPTLRGTNEAGMGGWIGINVRGDGKTSSTKMRHSDGRHVDSDIGSKASESERSESQVQKFRSGWHPSWHPSRKNPIWCSYSCSCTQRLNRAC